jgi:hypothetical protein
MAKVLNARVVGRQSGPNRRYIGRPDVFGNPFVIGRDGTRAEVIAKYAQWAPTQPHIMAALPELGARTSSAGARRCRAMAMCCWTWCSDTSATRFDRVRMKTGFEPAFILLVPHETKACLLRSPSVP